jgi:galactokinase
MSAAIDRYTAVVGGSSNGDAITLIASDFRREAMFSARKFEHNPTEPWASYVLGVVDQLKKASVNIAGFRASVISDVPIGAGLSSSAAMEVASALFLQQLFPYKMEKMEIARLCQRAENQFVGVSSGLLDQFSSTFGAKDHLLYLDCQSLDHGTVLMKRADVDLVICDSMAKHSLAGGDYNTRRGECMAAAAHFGQSLLRDIDPAEFERRKHELPENVRKRAEHVFGENDRVTRGIAAAREGDLNELGSLMTASHRSSRDKFENSTPELDWLVEHAVAIDGCYGSRLTGGGWGGATINLVDRETVDSFRTELISEFRQEFSIEPNIWVCKISDGAHVASLNGVD